MNAQLAPPRPTWTRRTLLKAAGGTAIAGAIGGLAARRPRPAAAATQRSIADFVAAQGTYCLDDGAGGCVLFVPPVANFFAWAAPSNLAAAVDYAGLADASLGYVLGTTTSGTVTERPLDDGRAEVSVVLRTDSALSWAIAGTYPNAFDYRGAPLLFGARVPDVLAGATPALGQSQLTVVFVNPEPGAPLPDLLDLVGTRFADVRSIAFRASAAGALRAAFGVPDGAPGRLAVAQTALFATGFHGAVADGFPAERVELHAVGH
jgi:hypothetical protein